MSLHEKPNSTGRRCGMMCLVCTCQDEKPIQPIGPTRMKPIQTKPMLYAYLLGLLQNKVREMGYNLLLHGSMSRDCDMVAVPWIDEPQPHFELIKALDLLLTGREGEIPQQYNYSVLPGGRHSYVINLNRGGYVGDGYVEDPQFYLDISVTPLPDKLKVDFNMTGADDFISVLQKQMDKAQQLRNQSSNT